MLYLEDLKSGNFTERQIQDYFCTLLDQKEIIYHYESRTNTDHRADVVMGDTVIEFKRYLSTSQIYQARGQAENYSDAFGCKKIWLVGCLPQSPKAADAAIRLANSIHTNTDRVRVIFIDIDAQWQPPHRPYSWTSIQRHTVVKEVYKKVSFSPVISIIKRPVGVGVLSMAAVAIAFFVPLSFFSHAKIDAEVARYYKQAYQPLNDYGYKSGSGQYHTAAINFQRMADVANNKCLKAYGENMATSALNADEVLKRTRNHQTAWKEFTSWQLQSWDEAEECQSEIMAIR